MSSSSSWVPVRGFLLSNLSRELAMALESRWWHHHEERRWAAAAAAGGPGQQLALARGLCDAMSASGYNLSCIVRGFQEGLDEALDPARRPRPDSAAWWRCSCSGRPHGFVHLSPGQVARARELLDGAWARAQRISALREDLVRRCWPAAADDDDVLLSTPSLLGRLRQVQRLADAALALLRALKRLLDDAGDARSGTRARSAPPIYDAP